MTISLTKLSISVTTVLVASTLVFMQKNPKALSRILDSEIPVVKVALYTGKA